MSKTIEFFMQRPDLVEKLPPELKQGLLAAVREELARVRSGGGALPQSAVDALTSAVDDRLMADIVADGRRNREPGWLPPKEGPAVERGSGWSTPIPLEGSVPGIQHIDRIAAHFDRLDRDKG